MKKNFKYFGYLAFFIAAFYIVFSLFLTTVSGTRAVCTVYPLKPAESPDKSFALINYVETCSDHGFTENRLYLSDVGLNKRHLIYKFQSNGLILLSTRWRSNEEIDIYVPVTGEGYVEEKFDVDKRVSYVYLKPESKE